MKLQGINKIILHRVKNGWVVSDDDPFIRTATAYVFESTESLADQLVDLVGHSGWWVSVPQEVSAPRKPATVPSRGPRGKFLSKHINPKTDAVQGL